MVDSRTHSKQRRIPSTGKAIACGIERPALRSRPSRKTIIDQASLTQDLESDLSEDRPITQNEIEAIWLLLGDELDRLLNTP